MSGTDLTLQRIGDNLTQVSIPLDYFGVMAADALRRLTNMDSNRKERTKARNELIRMATMAKVLTAKAEVVSVGLVVLVGGYLHIGFIYRKEIALHTQEKEHVHG